MTVHPHFKHCSCLKCAVLSFQKKFGQPKIFSWLNLWLWESPFHDFTFEELIDKLKQRFGSVGQSQKFRAELKSRRRQKGEPIQNVYADHHHHHLFLKRPFLPRSARARRLPRYEASPHIPENCPFRVQTKLVHVIFYTFPPCLPTPAHTSHPCHHHISTG